MMRPGDGFLPVIKLTRDSSVGPRNTAVRICVPPRSTPTTRGSWSGLRLCFDVVVSASVSLFCIRDSTNFNVDHTVFRRDPSPSAQDDRCSLFNVDHTLFG